MGRSVAAIASLVGLGIRTERLVRRVAGLSAGTAEVNWHDGGAGEPVILLNGFGASGLVWPNSWVHQLERHYRVIRVDNRGTGWSHRAPTPFTIADLADDVAAILDQCGLRTATVLGMSMGGMVAQELGIRHPDRVAKLILVSTIPPAPAHVPTFLSTAAIWATLGGTGSSNILKAEGLARLYLNTSSPKFVPSTEVIVELADQLRARPTPMMVVIQQARAIVAWRGSQRLHALQVPTVIVVGQDDPVVKPANSEALATLVARGRLHMLAGVGHMVPWEAPNALTALIAD